METKATREIQALLDGYGQTIDEERWDDHLELWAEDCHLLVLGRVRAGREAIGRFMECSPRGKHRTGLPAIELDGDRARSRTDYVFFDTEHRLQSAGLYVDELVCQDGRWRFARREIHVQLMTAE